MTTTADPSAPPAVSAKTGSWGLGTLALLGLVALPLVVYYLWLCVRHYQGALVRPASWADLRNWLALLPPPTLAAAAIVGGWVLLQVALQIAAPGRVREGLPL